MRKLFAPLTLIAGLLASCTGSDPGKEKIGNSTQLDAAPGWKHHLAQSKFHLGQWVTDDDTLPLLLRHVGTHGVFVEYPRTGAAMGSSNADSPAVAVPDLLDAAALRSKTLAYFVASGMPQDQLASSGISLQGGGSSGVTTTRTYVASAQRVLDGDFMTDSLAFAEFNTDGETKLEGVFWPEVPGQAIADARVLRAVKDDPAFLAKVDAAVPGAGSHPGAVRIHHSLYFAEELRFLATYDVNLAQGGAILHFDLDGNEVPVP
jgi:hypothetical protein